MRAYRLSVNLKLGLIVFAIFLAVASLAYTNNLVDRLREREQAIIQIWAGANEQVTQAPTDNPYQEELAALDMLMRTSSVGPGLAMAETEREAYLSALSWAQSMPPADQLNFILNEIIEPNPFGIPAILTDSTGNDPLLWRNVSVPDTLGSLSEQDSLRLVRRIESMAAVYEPIAVELGGADRQLRQYVYYDESSLVRELRYYPYIQLLFVGLFVLVGYLGFSYVRRSEQSSLWAGMAKEAAHQLGTPISSLMGWTELLRSGDLPEEQRQEALDEIGKDIARLKRVTNRFSDIGSLPKLEPVPLAPIIQEAAGYMRRRIPQYGKRVRLSVQLEDGLASPVNADLFEWVIENLLKNALDAIDPNEGAILVKGYAQGDAVRIDVSDTGKGIERRQRKNIFRPGYSTKRHGWGLGLSLARRIVVDYHGGSLTLVQSRPGRGSTFRIELPASGE